MAPTLFVWWILRHVNLRVCVCVMSSDLNLPLITSRGTYVPDENRPIVITVAANDTVLVRDSVSIR